MVVMWLILSLASVLIFTAVNLLMRVLAVKSENPRIFSFVFNSWGALFAILLFITEIPTITIPKSLPINHLILILFAIVSYGLYERTHFSARKYMDSSTITILFRLAPMVAFIGSLIFFKESITLRQFVGAALLLSSALLVIHKNPHLKMHRPLLIALFSALMLGIAWMLDKPGSQGLPASLYSFIVWVAPLGIIALPSLSIKHLRREAIIGGWKVALLAFLNVLGYFVYLKALSLEDASKIIPITSSAGTLTVIAGIIILKEKTNINKKLIAGVLMLIGILLLR